MGIHNLWQELNLERIAARWNRDGVVPLLRQGISETLLALEIAVDQKDALQSLTIHHSDEID
jgi:hypothetical protein